MGYGAEAFFRNQFACGAADAVGLVVDTYESRFEVFDEFALTLGQTRVCLAFENVGTFFEDFESWRCVGGIVSFVVAQQGAEFFV